MVSSSPNLQNLATDTWVKTSWEEFMVLTSDSKYANGRFYYHQGYKGRSGEIKDSVVLPGLVIALVEEALKRSQTEDDGEINRWLLQILS